MKTTLRLLIITLGLAALNIPAANAASQGNPNPGILPPQASYAGKTQGEWTAAWWNWVSGVEGYAPLVDDTGAFAQVNGNGDGPVFFLAKSWAGVPQTRHVTIPPGKALYIPVMGFEADSYFGGYTDPDVLMADVLATIPEAHDLAVTIDGREVSNLTTYLNTTGIFHLYDVNIPEEFNPTYPSFGWEYSLLVAPLTPGTHVIRMQASMFDFFTSDVTYYLTVRPGK